MATPFSQPKISRPIVPVLLLMVLIAGYTLYFSWYTINRHNTLNSYAADLSLIDQPMWNTVLGPGDFMELTWNDKQQPRLAEHFEPILVPLAALFFVWDNVRILLIAQSFALAIGALPVYWIAKHQLSLLPTQEAAPLTPWSALLFAVAYLLYPHLQAANIADFHADPFVVAPLLFAFWYAIRQRWRWMWLWAIVAMLTKENLPTLTAMLGLFIIFNSYLSAKNAAQSRPTPILQSPYLHGAALILISTIWFLGATYLIVAPLARQYFGTDGPIYFQSRYFDGLDVTIFRDPIRWRYLFGLFAAVGFLPLLAPELLILGLPVLAANFFSNFAGQHSGEQHYSAPLVAAFIIAAIYGTQRLLKAVPARIINGQTLKQSALIAACLWLSCWALAYHARYGWTPLSIRTEQYLKSPAAAALPALLKQIPADAIVSASAGLHPHLAHRRIIYRFPTIQDAGIFLVDVTDVPGNHPNTIQTEINALLNNGWQLLAAEKGLMLASKNESTTTTLPPLPPTFFDFTRPDAPPATPTRITFGDGRLQLLGYDIVDDQDDGITFRFYWQANSPLPEKLHLWPILFDDSGQVLQDPTHQLPMVAALWHPPNRWQPGEIITTETLPQQLPATFHLGIAVGPENSFFDAAQRYPISYNAAVGALRPYPGQWVQLASFQRQGPFLVQLSPVPTLHTFTPVHAQFGPAIQLTGFWFDSESLQSDTPLTLLLEWQTSQPPTTDFTIFAHLVAADGSLIAQDDSQPTWLSQQPTTTWPLDTPVYSRHALKLPPELPAGSYTIQLGLYNAQNLERQPLLDGDEFYRLPEIQLP